MSTTDVSNRFRDAHDSPGAERWKSVSVSPSGVPFLSQALVNLQRAAYAEEARLIGDDRIPTLHESAEELESAGLTWLLEILDDQPVGALAYTVVDGVVDIDRLMVDPRHHRRGIGRRLVEWARALAPAAAVATAQANAPARMLYEAVGFVHLGDREVLPGLTISEYATSPN